jgi:cell shape-determining protein MreD
MRRVRLVAAVAAILTALLLQGALVAPLASPIAASLPAVLVAAVALVDGPGAGMSFGFVCGLTADLGSDHPAGVLALTWLGVGLVAGQVAGRRTVRADAALAGVLCALASGVTALLLVISHSGGVSAWLAVRDVIPAGLVDALLALVLVPVARRFLRTDALRAAHPVFAEIHVDAHRA